MSYEGYDQVLCSNGHLSCLDAYETFMCEEDWRCHCGAPIAFTNSVDETNGDSFGFMDMGEFVSEPAVFEECPCCKHSRMVSYPVYRIPTEKERQGARFVPDGYIGQTNNEE